MTTIVMDLETQIDGLFDYVCKTAIENALGSSLPFVGTALASALTSFTPLGDLKALIHAKLDGIAALTDPAAIAAVLNGIAHVTASEAAGVISVHFNATDTFSTTTPGFDLSVGSKGLGVAAKGSAGLALGYALDLGVAYNTMTHELRTDTAPGAHEIALTLDGKLDINGGGSLGFLEVTATDLLTDVKGSPPELHLDFGLDIDTGLVVSDLKATDVHALINGAANIDVQLKTDLSTTVLPTLFMDLVVNYGITNYDPMKGLDGLGGIPTIALVNIKLDLGSFVDFLAGVFGPLIKDVFGSFPLGPLIDIVTAPIPIIDDATRALQLLPYFDLVGHDDKVNLLDIAVQAGADKDIIDNFALAFNLIKGITDFTFKPGERPDVKIDLGSITLFGDDPAGNGSNGSLKAIQPNDSLGGATIIPASHAFEDVKNGLAAAFGDKPPAKDGLGGVLAPLIDALSSVGLSIPLLSHPERALPLLLNHFGGPPVDLIIYDVPVLSYKERYDQFFPIIGPIGLAFGGEFGAGIDVDFGYDTKGLASKNFFDGFYLSTPKLETPLPGHYFAPAAKLGVGIDAAAAINVGVAEVAVGGGLGANLSAYFPHGDTPDGDGKLRIHDIGDLCIFDPIAGEFDATVFVRFTINFVIFQWSHRFDIADVTLAEFEFGCHPPETDPDGPHQGLATLNGQTLHLNVGPGDAGAAARWINNHQGSDTGEHYEIRNANQPGDPNALIVTAFTVDELHHSGIGGSPATITADMGDGRDVLVIGETVKSSAIVHGNDGDDLIVGGAGNDTLDGDDGYDHLIGGAGDDTLNGGAKDDLLEGGLGADKIDGGSGVDQVTYEHSKAGVIFTVDPDNHDKFIGHGGEAEGDTLTNVEYIIGSHFSDQIYANPDHDTTIEGLAGDDILIGGGGDDYIIGGAGADTIFGGGGENGTSYLTSAGAVQIALDGKPGHGGDAEGDRLYGIQDIQGSFADDVITGDVNNNIIDGWFGDDRLFGGGGADTIMGGEGNDIIYGIDSPKTSHLDGGGTIYNKGQDLISYERSGGGVTVNLRDNSGEDDYAYAVITPEDKANKVDEVRSKTISSFENITGSNYADKLTGDDGYNIITGLNGGDTIKGLGGNDTLIGGEGADFLDGGDGIDLADYRSSPGGVTVSLLPGALNLFNHAAGDVLVNVENLRGSDASDTLTGDGGQNEIDPGLSHSALSDIVSGGAGNDTLVVDYSRGDVGRGLIGGFDAGSLTGGSFSRAEANGQTQRDGVDFNGIERLDITGTSKDDVIFGGAGNDFIATGRGNDTIFTGIGVDRVFAGGGNDYVAVGTDANRTLSLAAGLDLIEIKGGAGIDTLSISLAAYTGNVVLSGFDGVGDFTGTNLVLNSGGAISEFERLFAVTTGQGDDRLTQNGTQGNIFVTGFGVDEIRPGLGLDFVDGGMDYRIGSEIAAPVGTVLTPVKSIDALYANDGDLLVLDYSSLATAVTGGITGVFTGFTVQDGAAQRAVMTDNGYYVSGSNQVSFENIERLDITGSSANDVLTGTDLLFGRNVGADGAIIASQSKRGDDRLDGGAGDDILIGNSGDDTLLGGAGNDLLLGAAIGGERGPLLDRGEVDTLTGGAGADIFVLGTQIGDTSIIYYNDGSESEAGLQTIGDRTHSGSNRAIITDFQSDDRLILAGVASDYRTTEAGGATHIYLRDGLDGQGHVTAANDELIADLTGVTGFRLDSSSVLYVGTSTLGNVSVAAAGAKSANIISKVSPVEGPGEAIAHRLANAAAGATAAATAVPHGKAAPAELSLAHTAPPAQLVGSDSWVTQTADPNALKAALFSPGNILAQGKLTLEGDAAAFGTFNGDPFGLGHGIVLSTGDVENLAGKNLIDGGLKIAKPLDLHFVKIGTNGSNTIYRADLTNLGFDLNSIRLNDHSGGKGGSGGTASGFDLNALALSHTRLDTLASGANLDLASLLPRIDAFSFDAANVVFAPGTQRPPSGGYSNGPDLEGSVNGLPDFNSATLDKFESGFVTLGDGGALGFNLSQPVSTKAPLYLYVAEAGANGETLTTGFTASSDRLTTPADLSTDLGKPGVDHVALTYAFMPANALGVPDLSVNEVVFDFVFFSEELVEYAQSGFNDNFKITLNGVNLAQLSDGSAASIDTLYSPAANGNAASDIHHLRTDTINSDFIYNPVGTGPAAGQTRADGYSKVLHFKGTINPGVENVLKVEVNDVRDGLLDSGILIRGGSFVGHSVNSFYADGGAQHLLEGRTSDIAFGLTVPTGGHPGGPLTVTLHPTAGLDLGAGAGKDVTRVLRGDGSLSDHVTAMAVADGKANSGHIELVSFAVTGNDAPLAGVASLVFGIDDPLMVTRTIGNAPERFSRAMPNAWADAWTASSVHITHTADVGGRAPTWSAVDFGTANPGLLSGSDILGGNLGVSGQARGAPGGVQDIATNEALRFHFDSGEVSAFGIDFARFERGDSARIELRDAAGTVLQMLTTSAPTFALDHLAHVADIIVSAASGAFMIHDVSFTETLDPRLGSAFLHGAHLDRVPDYLPLPPANDHGLLLNYQIA